MNIKAHAKINLSLNVVGKRSDGYHELSMVMLPLTLHDVIHMEIAQEDHVTCSDERLCMDASNTVVKAMMRMRKTYHIQEHFHIHVEKQIPAQAGLAGGSADGAAVLRGIRDILHLPISTKALAALGKTIGADVPFCVYQQCSVVKGIGEIVEPFTYHCPFHILLVKPQQGVSTPQAFQLLNLQTCAHPDVTQVVQCLCEDRFEDLHHHIANSLEESAIQLVPMIRDIKEALYAMGFPVALMSGSGSCVFALSRDSALIERAMKHFHDKAMFACSCEVMQ